MPRIHTVTRRAGAVAALALITLGAAAAQAQTYEVRVTNLTRGQVISPPIVVAHDTDVSVFTAGAPASDELAMVAEDAFSGPLVDLLQDQGADVVTAGGPLPPGQSVVLEITPSGGNDRLSVLGMLVTTNDAFFAVNGAPLGESAPAVLNAPAYDAGSEANNQDCAFIPGPPCGNEFVRDIAGAEGFVHIHNGVHELDQGDGVGRDFGRGGFGRNNPFAAFNQADDDGLIPARDDWRNPVARITVSPAE